MAIIFKAIVSVFTKMLFSVATENFLEWFIFYISKKIAESTKTPVDNEILEAIEKAYKKRAN